MARNIEIKARLSDPQTIEARLQTLSARFESQFNQEDSFFRVPWGRLKLRVQDQQAAELIYYLRPDRQGPKTSRYWRWSLKNGAAWSTWLKRILGLRGKVRKQRSLWMLGQTRIHLDQVSDLGYFIEFEVVLDPEQSLESGQTIADRLLRDLQVNPQDLCSQAYVDLILQKGRSI
ncbi:MAG: class IV adenylate cyclase [Acidobacteria bacterium]|nr:class IV adenylate cyclase [Acidobacteriota bacterium]MCB9397255.1 class IV adenylate cyclase [Acidobacteriota bacterium]